MKNKTFVTIVVTFLFLLVGGYISANSGIQEWGYYMERDAGSARAVRIAELDKDGYTMTVMMRQDSSIKVSVYTGSMIVCSEMDYGTEREYVPVYMRTDCGQPIEFNADVYSHLGGFYFYIYKTPLNRYDKVAREILDAHYIYMRFPLWNYGYKNLSFRIKEKINMKKLQ